MFKNYFKIALRNLKNNRSHALINILGLAIGIACCLLIVLWVADELSYDKWNEKADRTYRLSNEINFGGAHRHFAVSPSPLAGALRRDFPEIETSVRFRQRGGSLVKKDVQNYSEENIIYTDSTFFDVFSIALVNGNPKEALVPPNSIVISEDIAKKYFPNEDPIGKRLTFDNRYEYTVNGVMENMPRNSHFYYNILVSLTDDREANDNMWPSNNFQTYYVLKEGTDVDAFHAKVHPHMMEKYVAPQLERILGKPMAEFEASGAFIKYHYWPLKDIHLKSDLEVELSANGSIQYVWIFSAIALFILLIACINFMNLTTARSSIRAKEIGVRKVLGSLRSNLINQFLVESVVMTVIAFVLGVMMAQLALPYYNELGNKELVIPFVNPLFGIIALLSILVIGLLAGSYPAFYLSALQPIKTLSGKLLEGRSSFNLRNSLVVFQFLIAVLLIIGTLVINQQMNFIQSKKLGYDREQVLVLENVEPLRERANVLKKQLENNPKVETATLSGYLPVPSYRSDSPLCKTVDIAANECVSLQMWTIDEDYFNTFGMELVEGRNFMPDMATDSASAIIINETAAKQFGFDDPIGKKVYGGRHFNPQSGESAPAQTIVGVVKDFHFESLRSNIGPVSFWFDPYPGSICMKINTSGNELPALIANIERTWKDFAPDQPFAYHFLDESFDRIYRSEQRISNIMSIFSGLSIFIACLGLFGLAAFATERRTKEIGIRKVLGASTANLVTLLSKDFLKLVVVSLVIAIPIAWYAMNNWLEDFAYRIEIQWWVFVLAGLLAVLIAFITVSFQSIKAAIANPIDSLKTE